MSKISGPKEGSWEGEGGATRGGRWPGGERSKWERNSESEQSAASMWSDEKGGDNQKGRRKCQGGKGIAIPMKGSVGVQRKRLCTLFLKNKGG